MKTIKKSFLYQPLWLWLLLLLCCAFDAQSQGVFAYNKTEKVDFTIDELGDDTNGKSLYLNDYFIAPQPCDVLWQEIELAEFEIYFRIEDGERGYTFGKFPFDISVDFEINAYDWWGSPVFAEMGSLGLNEGKPAALYSLDITGFHWMIERIEVRFLNFEHNQPDVIDKLQTTAYYTEDFKYDAHHKFNLAPIVQPLPVQVPSNTTKVTFSWQSLCPEIKNYEFQLLRLYNKNAALAQSPTSIEANVDWSKALTIETESKDTSLDLTLAEGKWILRLAYTPDWQLF